MYANVLRDIAEMKMTTGDNMAAPLAFSIGKVIGLTGLSRTTLYVAIRDGDLRARKYRRRTIILAPDLADFLASMRARNVQSPAGAYPLAGVIQTDTSGDPGMNLCNDCGHRARSPSTDAHLCKRQPALLDLVAGHKICPLCSEKRFGREPTASGQMAKFFEKAEVA
jgi:hypothetical protein